MEKWKNGKIQKTTKIDESRDSNFRKIITMIFHCNFQKIESQLLSFFDDFVIFVFFYFLYFLYNTNKILKS